MKIYLLMLVLCLYGSISGNESKNETTEDVLINQLKEKGLYFSQENQTCKIHNNNLPFAMCQEFVNFLKCSKKQIKNELTNQVNISPQATLLNGIPALKRNAAFLFSEAAGIEYRQIDFKNLPKFNNKADFKDYLAKVWQEKNLDTQLSSGKVVLNLENLNFLNDDNSQAFIAIIEEKCKNNKIADNLLLFGTTSKNSEIPEPLSKFFKSRYTLNKSQEYVINNSKISYNNKNCLIDGISYPDSICRGALTFLAAINEHKKNKPLLSQNDTNIDNHDTIHKFARAMLLHGKPGNGKSIIGKIFAETFDAKLIELNSDSTFSEDYSATKRKIIAHFDNVKELLHNGEKVVLLIDKIESIGKNLFEEHSSEIKIHIQNTIKSSIDKIPRLTDNDQLIIIATTNDKNSLPDELKSRFMYKAEIKKPSNEDIAKEIETFFDKHNIKINRKDLLRAIKISKNFKDCKLCAEKIIDDKNCKSSEQKKIAENYKKCILSLQPSYKEQFSELLDTTNDVALKIQPIITTLILILTLIK